MQNLKCRQVWSGKWHRLVVLQERKEWAQSAWKSWMENAGVGSTVPGSVGSRECHSLPACDPTPLQERASLPSQSS